MPIESWASKWFGSWSRTALNFLIAESSSPLLKSNIASSYCSWSVAINLLVTMSQRRHFKGSHYRPALRDQRKFGKIKLRCLFQVRQSLLECLPLCGRACLRVVSHQPIAVRVGINERREIYRFFSHNSVNRLLVPGQLRHS